MSQHTNEWLDATAEEMGKARKPTKDDLLREIEVLLKLTRRATAYDGTLDKTHLARILLGLKRMRGLL